METPLEDQEPFLDSQAVRDLLPQRYPFLMLDCVLQFDKGERIVALKNITANEPYFQGHFPDKPVMPGVLIVEAMAQAAVILYGLSVDEDEEQRRRSKFLGKVDIRFIRPAYPGDRLVIDLRVIRLLEGAIALKGKVTVRGKPVTKGELIVMQPTNRKENPKDV